MTLYWLYIQLIRIETILVSPIYIIFPYLGREVAIPDRVQRGVLTIKPTEGVPEEDPTNHRQDTHGTVVPHEQWIRGQR